MFSRIVFSATLFLMAFGLSAAGVTAADEMLVVNFCTSCHGTDGAGPGESIPQLGGQTKEYIIIAMTEFKNRERYATLMQPIAQGYTEEEIEYMAEWFSAKQWKNSDNKIDKKLAKQGEAISESCAGCHGDSGEGMDEIPRISGMPSKYIYYSMLEYKNRVRNNDEGASMMDEVIEMNDEQLKALAEYYSGLR